MENASKALIIAGAILLSILIISLGIMVYNNAKNTVGSATLSKQEIETFNSQWQAYSGNNKTASEVKTMVQAVIASNAAENKSGGNRWVSVTGSDSAAVTELTGDTAVATTKPTITDPNPSNSKRYKIRLCYSSDGIVTQINWGT